MLVQVPAKHAICQGSGSRWLWEATSLYRCVPKIAVRSPLCTQSPYQCQPIHLPSVSYVAPSLTGAAFTQVSTFCDEEAQLTDYMTLPVSQYTLIGEYHAPSPWYLPFCLARALQ
jgi:hypothetical protein